MLIYKVTNTINGKVYVGCTSNSIERRWKGHIDRARYDKRWKSPFHEDIIEYGTRSFRVEIIQECTAQDAETVEHTWIERLNSYHPNGYNIRSGGIHSPMAASSRKKMRHRVFSPEHRANISKAMQGRKNPDARRTIKFAQMARWKADFTGEKNGRALLNAEQVQAIRRRYKEGGISQDALAKEYGVKQITISAIVRRKLWKHLPE